MLRIGKHASRVHRQRQETQQQGDPAVQVESMMPRRNTEYADAFWDVNKSKGRERATIDAVCGTSFLAEDLSLDIRPEFAPQIGDEIEAERHAALEQAQTNRVEAVRIPLIR